MAERLPVSSSGHLTLVPQLAGWRYRELDAELRKAFETALHLGSAAGFAVDARRALPIAAHALMLAPAVVGGLAFERPVEERLGSVRSIAVAQIGGGLALFVADRRPEARRSSDVGTADAAVLGLAQATALVPGVSRSGAVVTAARALAFDREAAAAIAQEAAIPVLVGAAALKGVRLALNPPPPPARAALAVGAAAAFVATLVVRPRRAPRYAVIAAYRIALGAAAFATG